MGYRSTPPPTASSSTSHPRHLNGLNPLVLRDPDLPSSGPNHPSTDREEMVTSVVSRNLDDSGSVSGPVHHAPFLVPET